MVGFLPPTQKWGEVEESLPSQQERWKGPVTYNSVMKGTLLKHREKPFCLRTVFVKLASYFFKVLVKLLHEK